MNKPIIKLKKFLTTGAVVGSVLLGLAGPASAANLSGVSVSLSDSRPAQTAVTYTIGFTPQTTTNVGCVDLLFRTTPTGSTAPAGMVTQSGVTLSGTTGLGAGGTWAKVSGTDGDFRISNATAQALTAGAAATITIAGVTNPTNPQTTPADGSYYVRITTYSADTCSTTVDTGTGAFDILNGVTVSATVDPILTVAVATRSSGAAIKADDAALLTSNCGASASALAFPSAMVPATDYFCGQTVTTVSNAAGGFNTVLQSTRSSGPFLRAAGTSNTIADFTQSGGSGTAPTSWTVSGSQSGFAFTTDGGKDANAGNVLSANATIGGASRFASADKFAEIPNSASSANSKESGQVVYSAAAGNITSKVAYRLKFSSTQAAGNYSGTLVYLTVANF